MICSTTGAVFHAILEHAVVVWLHPCKTGAKTATFRAYEAALLVRKVNPSQDWLDCLEIRSRDATAEEIAHTQEARQ